MWVILKRQLNSIGCKFFFIIISNTNPYFFRVYKQGPIIRDAYDHLRVIGRRAIKYKQFAPRGVIRPPYLKGHLFGDHWTSFKIVMRVVDSCFKNYRYFVQNSHYIFSSLLSIRVVGNIECITSLGADSTKILSNVGKAFYVFIITSVVDILFVKK